MWRFRASAILVNDGLLDVLALQMCDGSGSLWQRVQPFLIVAPCIVAASWLFMLFWIKKLYAEFG